MTNFSKVDSNFISPSSPLPKTDCKMKNKTCVCKKALSLYHSTLSHSLSYTYTQMLQTDIRDEMIKKREINTAVHIGACLVAVLIECLVAIHIGGYLVAIHIGGCLTGCRTSSLSHTVMDQPHAAVHFRAVLFLQPSADWRKRENVLSEQAQRSTFAMEKRGPCSGINARVQQDWSLGWNLPSVV